MKIDENKRYCGNCESHNCYQYPEKVFCNIRFGQGKDPIVDTLWCCPGWNQVSQECYCVREALKNKRS